jgi:hypothetical protein
MNQQFSIHGIGRAARAVSIAAGVTFLAACGGGSSSSGSGLLSLGVTDAPVDDATKVVVEFSSVTLKPKDGPAFTIDIDPAQSIDLLAQQNGKSELLFEDEQVTAGAYNWIRLGVNEGPNKTFIEFSGPTTYELEIPSSRNSGLKLVSGFSVADGGSLDLTIDFDLRKSVVETSGSGDDKYKLRPALRLVDNDNVGRIAVSATETYVTNNQCGSFAAKNSVYVFEGDVTPDDVDGSDPDPITTVLDSDDSDGAFTGTAAFLEPGTYTVAYVCDAEDDQPTTEENLTFSDVRDVDVESAETAEYELTL